MYFITSVEKGKQVLKTNWALRITPWNLN